MFKESKPKKSRGWEYKEITLDLNKIQKKKEKEVQISFFEHTCDKCSYFKVDKNYHTIDCLNRDIDSDSYFKYLGEGEKGCPYYKSV